MHRIIQLPTKPESRSPLDPKFDQQLLMFKFGMSSGSKPGTYSWASVKEVNVSSPNGGRSLEVDGDGPDAEEAMNRLEEHVLQFAKYNEGLAVSVPSEEDAYEKSTPVVEVKTTPRVSLIAHLYKWLAFVRI